MFSKQNRADKKVINKVFKQGGSIKSTNLNLRFFLEKDSIPHISFVVPKSVSKSAVMRNLLRRRGYLVLEKYLNKFSSDFNGVFLFGGKSAQLFSGKYKESRKALSLLEDEIKVILSKLR